MQCIRLVITPPLSVSHRRAGFRHPCHVAAAHARPWAGPERPCPGIHIHTTGHRTVQDCACCQQSTGAAKGEGPESMPRRAQRRPCGTIICGCRVVVVRERPLDFVTGTRRVLVGSPPSGTRRSPHCLNPIEATSPPIAARHNRVNMH